MSVATLFIVSWSLTPVLSLGAEPEATKSAAPLTVATVLDRWEQRQPKIDRAFVRLTCHEYDKLYELEKRSQVTLHFEPRSRYLFAMLPVEIPQGMVSAKRSDNDRSYHLETIDGATTWFVDGNRFTSADHATKTYSTWVADAAVGDLRNVLEPSPESFLAGLSTLGYGVCPHGSAAQRILR